jgi:hypothetical protein
MTFADAIADTTPIRAHLRRVVLAQWVRAGLALLRGAGTQGRGFVGGAVALWRVMQAVRLAMLLAQRLADAQGLAAARRAAASDVPGAAPAWDPAWPLQDDPEDLDLRRALEELMATITRASALAPPEGVSDWDREPSGSPCLYRPGAASGKGASPKAHGPKGRPRGRRPHRPPGLS